MIVTAPKFTRQQREAIERRNTSIALSAGAGCGKTFVLTERFLSHLEPGDPGAPPAKLHELVAITFTDRAAREMRGRIREKCYERLAQATAQKQIEYWQHLLRSLDTARISTIHSFCGSLLRANAVEAKLDPGFSVIEQTQADTLLAELTDDVLREELTAQNPAVISLIVQFGLNQLRPIIATLLANGRTIDFETWLARTPEEIVAVWNRFRLETVMPLLLKQLADHPATKQLLEVISQLGDATGELGNRCETLSCLFPELPNSNDPGRDLNEIVQHARVQGAGSKKSWPDDRLYDRFKESAEQVRKLATDAMTYVDFDLVAASADAAAGLELLKITKLVLDRYEARKSELAWLDFNDLMVRARDLLTKPEHSQLRERLSSQIRLLLVDECQDTDSVQVELIRTLCGDQYLSGQLFIVGDFKQSIYGFRGADPGVFREMQHNMPAEGRLPLSENFRSQPAILNFVNALFHDVPMAGEGNSLAYEPLEPNRPQVTPTPAVEFLWSATEGNRQTEGATEAARRREAETIARRIRNILDDGEQIVADKQADGTWVSRAVEKKDLAILFRTLSDVQHYEEALRRYNIEYYLVGGHAFYAQQEIFDIVNLLRAISSPADQVSLAGVLRSPMFALDDESLFWLAQHPQGISGGLYAERLPDELSAAQRERAAFAAATLKHLRDSKDRQPIAILLNDALARTGYDATLLSEFLGERKLANLRKLIDQARSFDRSGVLGLADFIVQLTEFVSEQPREALAATHPEGADVVRLMTIHQAKGLEFPVVFVPDVDRAKQPERGTAVWHSELGPLVRVESEVKSRTGKDLYRVVCAGEIEAERVRLLYVAITRAKDYLVLSGGLFNVENPTAPWTKVLAEHFVLQTGDCTTALPKGWAVPKVRVTTTLPPTDFAATATKRSELDREVARSIALAEENSFKPAELEMCNPLAVDAAARQRFSVSRLSGQLRPAAESFESSAIDDEESAGVSVDAVELGTFVHRILARVDFANGDVLTIVSRLAESQITNSSETAAEAEAILATFINSVRAGDLKAAKQVHRELEFLLAWPAPQSGAEASVAGDGVDRYLQGFIDCLYQSSDGRWHLLDYKTNRIAAKDVATAAAVYEMQLGVYALAVEQLLGQAPAELVVHFLQPSAEYRFTWNDVMRERTIAQVNQAMAALVNENGQAPILSSGN